MKKDYKGTTFFLYTQEKSDIFFHNHFLIGTNSIQEKSKNMLIILLANM